MKIVRAPGLVGYVTVALWVLWLIALPSRANAETGVAERLVQQELSERGIGGDLEIRFDDAAGSDRLGEASIVSSFSYNRASGRFILRVEEASNSASLTALTGNAIAHLLIPAPVRPIERGETIRADDLDWIETANPSTAYLYTEISDMVGMTARRSLGAGAPVRKADLEAPVLIRKGDTVSTYYNANGVSLRLAGLALENGGEGDLIEVQNIKSDRVIKAVVTGVREARAAGAPM